MEEKVEVVLSDQSYEDSCDNGCQRSSGAPTGG